MMDYKNMNHKILVLFAFQNVVCLFELLILPEYYEFFKDFI